jgi:sirohydrochlorin cobaltochelatase
MRDTTAAFADWLVHGGRRIGQLLISQDTAGWELRHVDDAGRGDLALFVCWQDARALGNLDDAGAYRPLKTAPTLRHGWRLVVRSIRDLRCALDYFYPAMLGMWLAEQSGEVAPTCLRDTLARQTGMYRVTQKLTDRQAQELIRHTCHDGACLKTIRWPIAPGVPIESLPAEKFVTAGETANWPLICAEACNILVAGARKVVKGEGN